MKKINKLCFFLYLLCLILFFLNSSYSSNYYADIDIFVDEKGFVDVSGITNYLNLLGKNFDNLTSKKNGYWILNITTDEIFSDALFRIHFPKNTNVNYIRVPKLSRFENSLDEFVVIGISENQKLNILVQYKYGYSKEKGIFFFGLVMFLFFLVISFVFFFIILKEKRKKSVVFENLGLENLNERQKLIVDFLKKNNFRLSQKKLEILTNLPKSSLSRNIKSLELRGVVEKKIVGMSNVIYLRTEKKKIDANVFQVKRKVR